VVADEESSGEFDDQVEGVASLAEPLRRQLYRFVVVQAGPVSREEAALGVGIALHAAKFHLDKLVADGLLEVEYSRPPGVGGPGAGRPAKRYRRADRQFSVSLPERRYELAGRLLARAIEDADRDGLPVREALERAARQAGREMGAEARRSSGRRSSLVALRRAACDVLTDEGFEPRVDKDGIELANCPFHALAEEHRHLVCGMNFALMGGLLDELRHPKLHAVLDPSPGRCCVRLMKK
jgi:predicted ArsR family transcriptional regulator